MQKKKEKEPIYIQRNKPTNILKRLVAGLIDMVLLFFIHYALYSLVLITPICNTLNSYIDTVKQIQDTCKLESGYGEKSYIKMGEEKGYHLYEESNEEGESLYYIVKNVEFATQVDKQEIYNKYVDLLKDNNKTYTIETNGYLYEGISYNEATTYYHIHNYLITSVFCGFIIEVIFFFIIPLIKNFGSTPGMFIAGIRMISSKNYYKPKWTQYLGRFLFIYFVESLLPYYFLAEYTLLVVPAILILVLLIFGRSKSKTLHDYVSSIMVIERLSYIENKDDIIDEEENKIINKPKKEKKSRYVVLDESDKKTDIVETKDNLENKIDENNKV